VGLGDGFSASQDHARGGQTHALRTPGGKGERAAPRITSRNPKGPTTTERTVLHIVLLVLGIAPQRRRAVLRGGRHGCAGLLLLLLLSRRPSSQKEEGRLGFGGVFKGA
jgi:hypothetical protein